MDILTTVPNGGYDFFSGSSFAAAQVSGIVALLLEYAPHLTPAEVQTLLRSGQPAESTGQADSSGGGSVVDAYGAVTALQQMLKENETTQRLR